MRLKITSELRSRDGTLTKGAAMKNALAEVHGDVIKAIKRPGLDLAFDEFSIPAQGIFGWQSTDGSLPQLAVVADDVLSLAPILGTSDISSITSLTTDLSVVTGFGVVETSAYALFGGFHWIGDTDGNPYIHKSADLISWTPVALTGSFAGGFPADSIMFVFGGYLWIILDVGSGFYDLYQSANGSAWSFVREVSIAAPISQVLVLGGTVYFLHYSTANPAFTSTDLINFTSHTQNLSPLSGRIYRYAVWDGKIVAGSRTATYPNFYDCTDLSNWAVLGTTWPFNGANQYPDLVADGTTLYVCYRSHPAGVFKVFRTQDGATFEDVTSSTVLTAYNVAPLHVVFGGSIYAITDGVDYDKIYKFTVNDTIVAYSL